MSQWCIINFQFLKKLNRQERVVEEVKMVLKPHYAKKHVTKEEYKEILRKSVPKVCVSIYSCSLQPIYKIQQRFNNLIFFLDMS